LVGAYGDYPKMTYRSTSSAEFFSQEEREEMRFLRALKGRLREDVAETLQREDISQEQLAGRLGFAPAQFSRLLSVDRHNTTVSLFRAMFGLGRRWTFASVPLAAVGSGNRSSETELSRAPVVQFFATPRGMGRPVESVSPAASGAPPAKTLHGESVVVQVVA